MKTWILLVAITFSFVVGVRAQHVKNDSLVLNASLVSVTPDGTDGEEVKFTLKFYMQLRNDSNRTVIALRPGLEDASIEFLDGLSPSSDGSAREASGVPKVRWSA